MAITVEEFLKIAKTASKLDTFRDDIIKLKQAKVSNKEILRFLAMNDVHTSVSNLCYFLKNLQNEPVKPVINTPETIETVQVNTAIQIKPPAEASTIQEENNSAATRPAWASKKSMNELC
jgi:hypothetical protein